MKYNDIPGWFDFMAIYDEAVNKAEHGAVFVELGSYLGQSTAYMAQKIKESGKKIKFFAVDFWENDRINDHNSFMKGDMYSKFMNNMGACGVASFIRPLKMSTHGAALYFKNKIMPEPELEISSNSETCDIDTKVAFKQGMDLDFVFVDANHKYQFVKDDIQDYLPMVKPGGTIAGHDIYFADVKRAVTELLPGATFTPSCWIYKKPTF